MTDNGNANDDAGSGTSTGEPGQESGEKTGESRTSCCSRFMEGRMMEMMGKRGGMENMMSMCREMMQEMGEECCPSGPGEEIAGEGAK